MNKHQILCFFNSVLKTELELGSAKPVPSPFQLHHNYLKMVSELVEPAMNYFKIHFFNLIIFDVMVESG